MLSIANFTMVPAMLRGNDIIGVFADLGSHAAKQFKLETRLFQSTSNERSYGTTEMIAIRNMYGCALDEEAREKFLRL